MAYIKINRPARYEYCVILVPIYSIISESRSKIISSLKGMQQVARTGICGHPIRIKLVAFDDSMANPLLALKFYAGGTLLQLAKDIAGTGQTCITVQEMLGWQLAMGPCSAILAWAVLNIIRLDCCC